MKLAIKAVQAVVGMASAVFMLSLASSAHAADITVDVGPVSIPNLPVEACFEEGCITTPALSEASASVSITTSGLVIPTITATDCPVGQYGVVLNITSAVSASAVVTAELTGLLVNCSPYALPLDPVEVTLSTDPVTISACADVP